MSVCFQDQGIDDDGGVVGRVKRVRRISNDNGCVSRGRGIDDASEILEKTTVAEKIRGR